MPTLTNAQKATRCMTLAVAVGLVLLANPLVAGELGASTVRASAEQMFAKMPKDYFTIKVVPAEKEIATGQPMGIDVREPSEFAEEHISSAKNIPLGSLVKQIKALPTNRTAPILVYCKSGHRGAMGLTVLRMLGYENVRSIYGGIVGWKNAGLPVTK